MQEAAIIIAILALAAQSAREFARMTAEARRRTRTGRGVNGRSHFLPEPM